jgi:hypothetical protein
MKIRELLAALRRRLVPRDEPKHPGEHEAGADEESILGPDGPLGPTGGQVGNPQRF